MSEHVKRPRDQVDVMDISSEHTNLVLLATAKDKDRNSEYKTPAPAPPPPPPSTHAIIQQSRIQPMIEYYYENQSTYTSQPNCFMLSTLSYPFLPNMSVASGTATTTANRRPMEKQENAFHYYQLINNFPAYRWVAPHDTRPQSSSYNDGKCKSAIRSVDPIPPSDGHLVAASAYWTKADASLSKRRHSVKCNRQQKFSNRMHPVQLLHQIFRKEAFVMEYERVNDGPFSQVRVTYKVNGNAYTAEATRLKEARRLCAKQVLRDQFPNLQIELDNDIPQPGYDAAQYYNKHPVQILYQIFKYEPMEMHCEEEGAAHFAKHLFTFSIRGNKYQAKAETIKEAKRRAAILALNDYLKEGKKLS